ncbi:hypothetical protein VIGAN_09030600 [Vigna angularis var. angularis]|uniref:Uncharacterized protein n=1 Tax=Vigna angularis var. angularis TaxID=157739 RepID=A0A0S3SVP2_PHAAN|nr:hypothetical protein VIGAN_09030600 [Vigna angularis var. angularis]
MNKKELAKNEEDIIETYSNSITVHETKLKTSTIQVVEMKFLAQRRDLQEKIPDIEKCLDVGRKPKIKITSRVWG